MRKTFNNRPNPCINHNGQEIWISRSLAVAGVILAVSLEDKRMYLLASKRGPNAADFIGLWNLCCGYLDWDESAPQAMARELYEEVGLDVADIRENGRVLINDFEQPWFVASEPKQNRQNVTLRYGLCFLVNTDKELPVLTTEYNEVVGEVEDPTWLPIEQINNHEWAFDHDKVVNAYVKRITPWIE